MEEPILGGMSICRPHPIDYCNGTEQGFCLMSDLHIGAPQVDYHHIQRELEQAEKNDDRILLNGDEFDMILVKDMKRFSADCLHPRLQGRKDVVNAAIDWGLEILGPYADRIDVIGTGNHEFAVERYHSIDPVMLLIYELEKKRKDKTHIIHHGGPTGFVDYRFRYSSPNVKENHDRSSKGKRFVIFYAHGAGGAAPVTHGKIDFARKDVWVRDAQVLWMGHRHTRWNHTAEVIGCPLQGDQPACSEARHVQTGAYFKTYVGQSQASIRKHGRRSTYAADIHLSPGGRGGARVMLKFRSHAEPYEMVVSQ